MDEKTKKLVESVEDLSKVMPRKGGVLWRGYETMSEACADALRLCAAIREMNAENEQLRALLHKLIDIDERGVLGDLSARQKAFVELGAIVPDARRLLERPIPA